MSEGIVLSSGSIGATKEDLERVFANHGLEPEDEPGESGPEAAPEPQPSNDQPVVSMQEHWNNYKAACEQFRQQQFPDWEAVVNRSLPISREVYEAIIAEENPAITYHLGRNPEFTKKLAKMQPSDAVAEIRKLADRLRPEENVVYRGTTTLRSGNTSQPASNRPLAKSTAAAAAARRDYRAFKATQRPGRGLGRLA